MRKDRNNSRRYSRQSYRNKCQKKRKRKVEEKEMICAKGRRRKGRKDHENGREFIFKNYLFI